MLESVDWPQGREQNDGLPGPVLSRFASSTGGDSI